MSGTGQTRRGCHHRAALTSAVVASKMATVIRPVVTMPAGVMRPLPLRLMFFPMCRSKPPSISSGCVIGTPGTVSLICIHSIAFDRNVAMKGRFLLRRTLCCRYPWTDLTFSLLHSFIPLQLRLPQLRNPALDILATIFGFANDPTISGGHY
jgi:hypothetical protein